MAKIFLFRGKTLEELQKMSIEEFAKLLTSRARRHLKRGLEPIEKSILKKIGKYKKELQKPGKEKILKTHARHMVIMPEFVGVKFGIYNGKTFVIVDIIPEMIGHRLGEFAKTRQKVTHSGPGIGATRGTKFSAVK